LIASLATEGFSQKPQVWMLGPMIGGHSYFSPGLYFKIPLGLGESDGRYHHLDWDWDD
jgi:hypothetical protein